MNKTQSPAHYSVLFVLIVGIFVTCLITANIIAVKLVVVAGLILPAGVIIFPISYIFGDVLTEVYGYQRARRIIWLAFFCNLIAVVAIIIAQRLPPAVFWDGQPSFERILGYTPRLLIASFAAFLVGEFANSYILSRMKVATRGRWLWTRTIASTIVGEGLDSIIFIFIAFWGTSPEDVLLSAMVTQWSFKVVYEVVATPFTYVVVNYVKRKEGIDIYDHGVSFNPFSLIE